MAKSPDEQAKPANAVAENGMAVLRLLASQRPRELFTGFQKQLLSQISQALGQTEPRRRAILEKVYRALSTMPNQLLQDIYHYLHSALDQFANHCLVSSDAALRANADPDNTSLSLVSPELLEEQALITSLRQRADSRYQGLLWPLSRQMAQVSGGSANLDGNPLAPVRFCLALRHGLDKAGVELPVKKIIYRLFDDAVLAQLEPFYQQLSDGLKVVGIVPEQHFDVVKAPLHQPQPLPTSSPPLSAPQAVASPPPAVDHSGDNLLHQLTALLGNGQVVLHESHRHTIEVVDGVMAEFSRNSRLSAEVKALFSLLHMPLLKVALADPQQFQQMHHPARQLLVDMVEAATDWLQGEQRELAVFHHIRGAVERLLRNTSVDNNAFAEERDNFRQQVSALHRRKRQQARRQASAQSSARSRGESVATALRRRIGKQALPEAISELLYGHWTDYLKSLAIELGRECHQNSRWQDALSVVDDLLWGLQINPDNRSESQRWRQNYLWLEAVLASGLDHLSLDSGQCQRLLSAVRGEYSGLLESRRAPTKASADVTPLSEPQEKQRAAVTINTQQWLEKLPEIELHSWLNFASGRREQLVWRNLRTLQFEFRDPQSGKSSIRTGDDLARLLAEQTATLEQVADDTNDQQNSSDPVVRGINYIAK
ncbi:DUF1631 family protein [Porticoccus sp. GXU_MW_L64]